MNTNLIEVTVTFERDLDTGDSYDHVFKKGEKLSILFFGGHTSTVTLNGVPIYKATFTLSENYQNDLTVWQVYKSGKNLMTISALVSSLLVSVLYFMQ